MEKNPIHNVEISDFEREYFIQTRKEIDTEKQERNKLLNYGVVSIAAISVAILQFAKEAKNLDPFLLLMLYFPLLYLISVLVAARRIKMRQIRDRWFTLYDFFSIVRLGNCI